MIFTPTQERTKDLEIRLLEKKYHDFSARLGIKPEKIAWTKYFLSNMKAKDKELCRHSLIVGIYVERAVISLGLNPEEEYPYGVLHDTGKIGLPSNLPYQGRLNAEDWWLMRQHPFIGYLTLKPVFPGEAKRALQHQTQQFKRYPTDVSDSVDLFTEALSVIDSVEAMSSRANGRYVKEGALPSMDQIRDILLEEKPKKLGWIIKELYDAGVFRPIVFQSGYNPV